jgi:hypothetical protein
MYYCFPTSVQAGSTQQNDTRNYELELIGEIADSIVEFAANLLNRIQRLVSKGRTKAGRSNRYVA